MNRDSHDQTHIETLLASRLANLSPEKRSLFEKRLSLRKPQTTVRRTIPRMAKRDRSPLSTSQERLWFLDQLKGDSIANHLSFALKLEGLLNKRALQQALDATLARHEALRTTFHSMNGVPYQRVDSAKTVRIRVVDAASWEPVRREEKVQDFLQQQAYQPFNLSTDAMLRGALLKLSDNEHILLVTMHHIASDGWSVGILQRELSLLYNTFSQDAPSSLPALSIQHIDFSCWERNRLTGDILDVHIDYWKQELIGAPTFLNLPTDYPRPRFQTFAGSYQKFAIDQTLASRLKDLSRECGATLFMTLMAVFTVLLARYSGQEDILVGSPIANRNHRELESVIGFFVNTLVLRTRLQGNPTFAELLSRVRRSALEAYDHKDIPFEQLATILDLERNQSHSPWFQTFFALQNAPKENFDLLGLSVSAVEIATKTAKFDLTMNITETVSGLNGVLSYNTDLFDEPTISRLIGNYQVLLAAVVDNPQQHIWAMPVLTKLEREQLLLSWSGYDQCQPVTGELLHRLFEEQVVRSPTQIAVASYCSTSSNCQQSLTYEALNSKANQLARYLQSVGVGPNVFVGLFVKRSVEMVIALLAVLKAGGAYVPLDPEYPSDRLAFMISDAQISVLLTQQCHLDRLSGAPDKTICLDRDWQIISQQAADNLDTEVSPDDLAYVIYTSGSTGTPKGVMVEHSSLVNFTKAVRGEYGIRQRDRILQFSSVSFDTAAEEIYPCLTSGSTLVLRTDEMLDSVEHFLKCCDRWQITVLDLPTAYWHQTTAEIEAGSVTLPQCLRLMIVGGERLSPAHVKTWQKAVGDFPQLINGYGPTETTVVATACTITTNDIINHEVPIGRAIANVQTYVLDQQQQPVPIGVAGELYIGGAGVARGYLNRPELTNERFIPNLFSDRSQDRLYRTGDLVRYLSNGNLEFLGRIDQQVKIRGFRVELGEIEVALLEHPHVQETVVTTCADTVGTQQLIAYVVAGQEAPSPSELRPFVQSRLPVYMVPATFVSLERLPLTPTGKVDRKALPVPDLIKRAANTEFVAPRNQTEVQLSKIWQALLNIESVGIHDNFFELGGHSLLATQLISRIRTAFSVALPLRTIFRSPTVAKLSVEIEQQEIEIPENSILPVSQNQLLPLSFSQQRLWFLDQLEGQSPHYNMPKALQLSGPLNIEALEQAINQIIYRHEVLRTTFQTVNREPVQVIAAATPLNLQVIALQTLSAEVRSQRVQQITREATCLPFNLAGEPKNLSLSSGLIRVRLLKLSSASHLLLVVFHHIVFDGWSVGVFMRELSVLYGDFCAGRAPSLPELPIQYADFAYWQRQYLSTERRDRQTHYWKRQLAGAPVLLDLPIDYPRPQTQSYRGNVVPFHLTADLTRSLKILSQRSKTTLFITLLSAFFVLLYRISRENDIVVGSPVAGRTHQELEPLIGFFSNTLPLRANLDGSPTFLELLSQIRQTTLDAYAHQDLPFEKLVETINPRRSLSHHPLFQVMFALQNAASESFSLDELSVSPAFIEWNNAKFDLSVSMAESSKGMRGSWIYSTDLFEAKTVEHMAQQFQILLEALVQTPDQPIDQVSLLSAEKRLQISAARSLHRQIEGLSLAKRSLLEEKLRQRKKSLRDSQTSDQTEKKRISSYRNDSLQLSFFQQNLWLADRITPGNPAYNRPTNIRFSGALDTETLERSLLEIIHRHEILRTYFSMNAQGEPVQIVSDAQLALRQRDLTGLSKLEREAEVNRLAVEEAHFSFDLSQLPLIRANLLQLEAEEHILLLTLHHTIFDGWSMSIFLKELAAYYQALSTGRPLSLPPLPMQYADFARQQRQQLDADKLRSQLAYWRKQLGGTLPTLKLTADYVRTKELSRNLEGAEYSFVLDKALKARLILLSNQEQSTLFMTLLAGFKTLLYRYTGEKDITAGVPIAGRNDIETEDLIGLFINTLVLRTALEETQTFQELLSEVRRAALEAYAHPDIPLQKLVETLNLKRELKRSTLFQVLFQYRNLPEPVEQIDNLKIEQCSINSGLAMLELSLEVYDRPDGLTCQFRYRKDLFRAETIQRMGKHFKTLLESIVAAPTQLISRLPIMSEQEQHKTLHEWHRSPALLPHDADSTSCIHRLFEVQAARTPDSIAVCLGTQTQTYQQLNQRANQVARYLVSIGVQSEDLIGVCIDRSIEMVAALLGVLKAGGAYVPIDPYYPSDRIEFMLSDAKISTLLTQERQLGNLQIPNLRTVCLDRDWETIAQQPADNLAALIDPQALAYVMYTSGSTGTPKGVMVQHRSLVNFTLAAKAEYGIDQRDRILQFASISFDTASEEIYPCLISGSALVLRTDELLGSVEQFCQKCDEWQLTILDLPTAYWQRITAELVAQNIALPAALRLVIIGGERVSPESVKLWQQHVGEYPQLTNTYGPTEGTVVTTTYPILAMSSLLSEVPIGRAIANTSTYVLDSHLCPVPIGVPGELYIGGAGVAKGYLHRLDLTAERFIQSPFGDDAQARLYKTGDLVRYLPDGNLEFLGRIDHQVKIRGFRIEPGEIESVLISHAAVKEAVVGSQPDRSGQSGESHLVAYVVFEESATEQRVILLAEELRQLIQNRLPAYMVPSAFVHLEALPLTQSGKIDRQRLPAADRLYCAAVREFVAPQTEIEETLSQIWRDLLRAERISIHDDFFELGGHSLLATQVISRIRETFSAEISLQALFESPTVEKLAKTVEQHRISPAEKEPEILPRRRQRLKRSSLS